MPTTVANGARRTWAAAVPPIYEDEHLLTDPIAVSSLIISLPPKLIVSPKPAEKSTTPRGKDHPTPIDPRDLPNSSDSRAHMHKPFTDRDYA